MEERKIYDIKRDEIVFSGFSYQCEEFLKELKKNKKVETAFGYYIPDSIDDVILLPKDVVLLKIK